MEKNKYFSKGKLYQYDIIITKNNFWGDIPCPKVSDIDRTTSNHNNYKKIEEENEEIKEKYENDEDEEEYKNKIDELIKEHNNNIFFVKRKLYNQGIDLYEVSEQLNKNKLEVEKLNKENIEIKDKNKNV